MSRLELAGTICLAVTLIGGLTLTIGIVIIHFS